MKELSSMSSDERSLLLYLETRAVDYGGRVDIRRMNTDDINIAEKWAKEGFIKFGRIVAHHINSQGAHFCILSDEAWDLAHAERRLRSERMWLKRDWISTSENVELYGSPHLSGMNSE